MSTATGAVAAFHKALCGPFSVQVESTADRGRILRLLRDVEENEVVFAEKPFVSMQHVENEVIRCAPQPTPGLCS